MKLRIKDASIRLRLTQGEVSSFADAGVVAAMTPFGPERTLSYALETSDAADTVTASFEGTHLSIVVPIAIAHRWATTEEVGIEAEQQADGRVLQILVEKDFQCLHNEDVERDPDAYPHPLANA